MHTVMCIVSKMLVLERLAIYSYAVCACEFCFCR